MDRESEVVLVCLPNGVEVGVEVASSRRPADVGVLGRLDFDQVQGVVEGLAEVVVRSLRRVRPQKATAELGLSLKVESGRRAGRGVRAVDDALDLFDILKASRLARAGRESARERLRALPRFTKASAKLSESSPPSPSPPHCRTPGGPR
jgi:hypothetical protein